MTLLFANIPIKNTIDFFSNEIYVQKKLESIDKKSIFKKLLYQFTKECLFTATEKI